MDRASNLATALAELQQVLPEVKRTERAEVATQKGSFSYTYAGLADVSRQILPLLGQLGLSFSCRPTVNAGGQFVLAYELLHVCGESRSGEYPLGGSTPQAVGSAITYARRYTLLAVTGLAPDEDDDAASAEAEARRPGNRSVSRGSQVTQPREGRTRAPAAERVKTDGPPLPGEPEATWTQAQQRKVMASFADLGITERADRLAYCIGVIGREITSSNELTVAEAGQVIEAQAADAESREHQPEAGES